MKRLLVFLLVLITCCCAIPVALAATDLPMIDAFDYKICGFSNKRAWQQEQNGFGCPPERKVQDPSATPTDNEALNGEFPSHAQLVVKRGAKTALCSASLVHKDLLLTVASCVKGADKIKAVLGSNLNAYQGVIPGDGLVVDAKKWCWDKRYGKVTPHSRNFAMVKLAWRVKYVEGRIQPVCIRPESHTWEALLSVAGFGAPRDDTREPSRMKTLKARRCIEDKMWPIGPVDPTGSCQVPIPGGMRPCDGFAGAPVHVYDNQCNGSPRSYLTSMVSHGPTGPCNATDDRRFYSTEIIKLMRELGNMAHYLSFGRSIFTPLCSTGANNSNPWG